MRHITTLRCHHLYADTVTNLHEWQHIDEYGGKADKDEEYVEQRNGYSNKRCNCCVYSPSCMGIHQDAYA